MTLPTNLPVRFLFKVCALLWTVLGYALAVTPLSAAQTVTLDELTNDSSVPVAYTFKTTSEGPLQAFVYRPDGWQASDRRPVVVYVHGGGWTAGGPANHDSDAKYFARRGLVAINVAYRLCDLPSPTLFDAVSDVRSALRWIRASADILGIDPNRVCVVGESAGGHLAACLGMIDGFDDPADDLGVSALPDAVVLLNPIMDIPDLPWIAFNDATKPFVPVMGAAPATVPDPEDTGINGAWRLSPLYSIREGLPPTLILHGSRDPVVDPDQASLSYERLLQSGNTTRFLLLEGAFHAFSLAFLGRESEVVVSLASIDDFLGYLGFLPGSACIAPFHTNLLVENAPASNGGWTLSGGAAFNGNANAQWLDLVGAAPVATRTIALLDFPFHPTGLDAGRYSLVFSGNHGGAPAEALVRQRAAGGALLAEERVPLSGGAFAESSVLGAGTRQVELELSGGPAQVTGLSLQVLTRGAPESFAHWQNLHFTPQERANAELAGPLGQTTPGGPVNLMKYALGLDREEDSLQRNFFQQETASGVAMGFYRNPFQADLSIRAQATHGPPGWSDLYDSALAPPPNNAFERHEVSLDFTGDIGLLRLRVGLN